MTLKMSRLLIGVAVAALAAGVGLMILGLAGIAPGSGGPATPPQANTDARPVSGFEPWIRPVAADEASVTYALMVSSSPDRSSPLHLEGQTVSGDIYVFVSPDTGISQVRFFFDDPAMAIPSYQTGAEPPYDFVGGSAETANAFNTTTMADGPHTIGAEIGLSDGETVIVGSTFAVLNPVVPDDSSPPMRLVIEAIAVDAPVIPLGVDSELAPEVPSSGAEVAWYDFSANPGTGSNVVLAGHVTWDKKSAVFWELGELQVGDLIQLTTERGDQLVYEVTANLLVDPSDPESVRLIYPTDTEMLTLVTCGGTFNRDAGSRFGGEYTHRSIVQAKPVN